MDKLKLDCRLFLMFAQIGLFTIGGGYAMLPLIQREIVEKRQWATNDDVLNYYALGQCTPGIIAVNVATFIGYKMAGVFGGIFATLGVVFPSLVIISFLAICINYFADLPLVQSAFAGIRVAVAALVAMVIIEMSRKNIKNKVAGFLCLAAFAAIVFFAISPVLIVVIAGLCGIFLIDMRAKEDKQA